MSDFINGKEALIALANGLDVQYKCDKDPSIQDRWTTITHHYLSQYNLGVFLDLNTTWKFRIKPKTVNLNGVEVPAPFEPELEDRFFYIDANYPDGFNYGFWEGSLEEKCRSQFGTWSTEEEIKQVVEALRSVFK